MGRTPGAKNKQPYTPKTETKYRVTFRDPFQGTEYTMEFPTVQDISNYFTEHGVLLSRSCIDKYIQKKINESLDLIEASSPKHGVYNEVILENKPCKLYIDLDWYIRNPAPSTQHPAPSTQHLNNFYWYIRNPAPSTSMTLTGTLGTRHPAPQ
jgi:hypothetical protein